ncbi:DHA2 family efflux MFS transporter permease subunit [Bacillus sp. FJAT-49732]|uniref:DHA2 family efflux MFS transporter permease subunit n=1 Tax=Lederbergia citrisecunda TaxID=2833583 RepID=A0A942TPB8_9BACI|nr:DHA2 family efflux MFS transporter permease subunit [Lederbergia citrisecunda]MBS4201990.1 DHA2 family efflux MFS transporter permease subunit [Lederbergia citrisecunda]
MSIYIAGYILLSILLLTVVNFMLWKTDKKATSTQKSIPALEIDETDDQDALTTSIVVSDLDEKDTVPQGKDTINPARFENQRGKIVSAMMLGAFVAILNQTLLNVAIPHIMNDLSISASTVQWLSTGYMLTNGIFIPITAFLIARLGTRKLFLSAVSAFTVGSVICSISTSFSILMLGRVVQAAGAGIIMPLLMTVFLTIFPKEKRGAAMGLFGVAILFAPAIGPTLSGWLIGHYSWRILFDIVIPFGVIALILAFFWMADVTEITKPKFDTYGFIFSTIGLGFLLYGFSEAGNNGWGSTIVLVTLIIGVIGLIAFIWRELTADEPMLELRVFKYDIFALTTVIGAIINMAMFAAMLLLPIYLQNIRGFSALDSGLLMLPGAIVMAIMMPISGWLFDKIGARWLAVFGLIVTVITTWQFTTLSITTSYGFIMLLYVMRMFGMSFLSMTVTTEGMNQLPTKLAGHGTSASNTARTVAGSIGTAFLVTVMTTRSAYHTANYSNVITSTNPYLANKIAELGHGLSAIAGIPVNQGQSLATSLIYGEAVKHATISGINDAFVVATGIAGVALLLAFFIKRAKPSITE